MDEKSSLLTDVITQCGRYRSARLPFRLNVSSEIFQRKLNEALAGLDGTFIITDNIIKAGHGETEEKALTSTSQNFRKSYIAARKKM